MVNAFAFSFLERFSDPSGGGERCKCEVDLIAGVDNPSFSLQKTGASLDICPGVRFSTEVGTLRSLGFLRAACVKPDWLDGKFEFWILNSIGPLSFDCRLEVSVERGMDLTGVEVA